MKMTSLTPIIQRSLLLLNAMQLTYLGAGYLNGAFSNQYPILERLFKPEIASVCISSGCWQSIVPFLGSMYLSTAFISILVLFFFFSLGKRDDAHDVWACLRPFIDGYNSPGNSAIPHVHQ